MDQNAAGSEGANDAPCAPQLPGLQDFIDPPKPGPGAFYWANLILLAAVAVGASLWFSKHLETYVDQVLLLGGGVSVWAALKLGWTFIEKSRKTDAWEAARGLLHSSELSQVLLVALGVVGVLWFTTASQYFEYDGPGTTGSNYAVHVLLGAKDGADALDKRKSFSVDPVLSPNERVRGQVFYWLTKSIPLTCVLEKTGVPYEPLDCSIQLQASTRVKVPGAFHLRKVHLLRILPSIELFGMLPSKRAPPLEVSFRLTISRGNETHVIEDMRQGILHVGGRPDEMDELLAMQASDELPTTIRTEVLSKGINPQSAEETTAVLMSNQRKEGKYRLATEQKLKLVLERLTMADGRLTNTTAIGAPTFYEVTDEKVQTIWLPGS